MTVQSILNRKGADFITTGQVPKIEEAAIAKVKVRGRARVDAAFTTIG